MMAVVRRVICLIVRAASALLGILIRRGASFGHGLGVLTVRDDGCLIIRVLLLLSLVVVLGVTS